MTATSSAPIGVFAALGDPTRAQLLSAIARSGASSATNLTRGTDITRQAVTRHLQVLTQAGLVEARREGREVLYSVRSETLNDTADWLNEVGAAWDEQLELIRALAENRD